MTVIASKLVQYAVITGASSGIGAAFARELAAMGTDLLLIARREDRLRALAQELQSTYLIKVDTLTLDLTDADAAQQVYRFCVEKNRSVDLLINNAGTGPYRYFLEEKLPVHLSTLNLNCTRLTELTHLFAEHMLAHGRPSYIANIASIAAYQGVPRFALYAATKTYVRIFSQILNRELRGTSVSVTCVCPGGTATEFLEKNGQKLREGKASMLMSAQSVAQMSLRGIFKRKAIVIPGLINKIACYVPQLLPYRLGMRIAEIAMKKTVDATEANYRSS